jgi:hypothetical protein
VKSEVLSQRSSWIIIALSKLSSSVLDTDPA